MKYVIKLLYSDRKVGLTGLAKVTLKWAVAHDAK